MMDAPQFIAAAQVHDGSEAVQRFKAVLMHRSPVQHAFLTEQPWPRAGQLLG